MKRYIIVWFNPNCQCYYYKNINGYYLDNYYIGYKNAYNHEIILVIDIYIEFQKRKFGLKALKNKLIDKSIHWLERKRA